MDCFVIKRLRYVLEALEYSPATNFLSVCSRSRQRIIKRFQNERNFFHILDNILFVVECGIQFFVLLFNFEQIVLYKYAMKKTLFERMFYVPSKWTWKSIMCDPHPAPDTFRRKEPASGHVRVGHRTRGDICQGLHILP